MKFNAVKSSNKTRLIALLASAFGLLGMVLTPATAQAGASLHLDLPGLSIGVDDHHYKKKRYRRSYRNSHRYNHRNNGRLRHYDYNNHYYNDYKPRRYQRRHDKNRYYNRNHNNHYNYRYNNGYNNDYYYGGRSNRGYNNRRNEVCPLAGYSPYYNDNLRCYRHKDHFHCS